MFRSGAMSIRIFYRLVFACVLMAAGRDVSAAELNVSDLMVSYSTQSATEASGSISFNLRIASLGGNIGGYDLFSSQVLVSRMGLGETGKFHLDEAATEATGSIGGDYWLSGPPTGFQNSSTIGSEFRFTDFVSVSQNMTPDVGDIVAHFVIDFDVQSAAQFGTYQVAIGNTNFNYFNSDFVNRFDNTINSVAFELLPVPEPATLLPLLGMLLLLRRRR